ncbi:hypothetical protein Dde_0292 [Oleidesulfovibrio alaskensis G20]|jgi:hypothetical protein|uniref:Uncharacterized protein n=1 Tax=Oleidesulfovibrio alaskensis (strain ATCC BAA-1058 / DSM 17464 / G20) TaxID=207559 RepID=Q316Q3_OLEA2|nr:hypothetical protein [Oleidesulfovibrio alaskensis]ABB37093.1 hypothetical protein Dde_0292 [Oleidesulfovibrio alaskensis G20]MBG0772966.1 hypothetical protein [Oleidesulfovibrio alaskensis]MBL3582902.1 hypothetical protein [Oleidesulfovibrio alaskensis]
MNPAALIPPADSIPVHWAWLEGFLLLTFGFHLLFMNSVVGSAVIATVRAVTRPQDPAPTLLGKALPSLLALTINFGVAPLLFAQVLYGGFLYTSSVIMAVYWLGLIFVLIAAYYLLYGFSGSRRKKKNGTVFIAAACALLLFTGFVLVNNVTLMLSPDRWVGYFEKQDGSMLNLGDPTLWPRILHFLLACLAVGGLTLALLARRAAHKGTISADVSASLTHDGLRWFFWSTAAQMLAGPFFLFSLPRQLTTAFMGRHGLGTALLLAGTVCGLAALHFAWRSRLRLTIAFTAGAVALMVGVRSVLRTLYLAPWFSAADIPSEGQYSPLILFFGSLLLTGALMVWVLRLALNGRRQHGNATANGTEGEG